MVNYGTKATHLCDKNEQILGKMTRVPFRSKSIKNGLSVAWFNTEKGYRLFILKTERSL